MDGYTEEGAGRPMENGKWACSCCHFLGHVERRANGCPSNFDIENGGILLGFCLYVKDKRVFGFGFGLFLVVYVVHL